MKDVAAAEPGDKDNSDPGAAAGLPDVLAAIKSRKELVEVSDISSSKHDVASGFEEGCQGQGCLLRAPNNQQIHGLGSCQNI